MIRLKTRTMDLVAKSKLIIFPLCLVPLVNLILAVNANALGPDPGNALTHGLGSWALRFLLITLAITPLRKITGFNKLVRYRRMIGLFALFYAVLHLLSYFAFMLAWEWATLFEDLVKRPYIIVGALAVIILVALGVTSTKKMMRRLGKQWAKLHKLVYPAAVLAVIHFLWLVKSDYTEPGIYGLVLLTLMALRLPVLKRLYR